MHEHAHQHLISVAKNTHTAAHKLFVANGIISLNEESDVCLFDFLSKVVSGQQLSKHAARTIFGRLEAAAHDGGCSLFDFICNRNQPKMKACGLSGNKVKALLALKDAFESGSLVDEGETPPTHEEITEAVTSVWGFGPWSADMTAIFYYGLPDVWSEPDGALRKGIEILTGRSWQDSLDVVSDFAPYRSFLALHIWKGLDDGVLQIGP